MLKEEKKKKKNYFLFDWKNFIQMSSLESFTKEFKHEYL